MNITFYDYIVIANFLISLSVFYQKPTPIYLKLFPVYFLSAFICGFWEEWLARHGRYNTGVSNVWGTIEFCFYFFVLREIIINKKIKRTILYLSVFFAVFAFSNLIFIRHKVGFNPVNFTIGCLITVLACIYYIVELFQKTETETLSRLPAFWISSAILFNTVLSFPIFAIASFLEESTKVSSANQFIYRNLGYITLIMIILTTVLYAIGFLCRIRIRKSA